MSEAALTRQQSGTILGEDYRGVPVLSSFAPLDIQDVHWAVLAEIDEAEAMAPVADLARRLSAISVSILLGATVLTMLFAWWFLRPFELIVGHTRKVAQGDMEVRVPLSGRDEFGQLSGAFNEMLDRLGDQNREYETRIQGLEGMLHALLPPSIVAQLHKGEKGTNVHDNVSYVLLEVRGNKLGGHEGEVGDALRRQRDLVDALDDAAARNEVEKVRCVGPHYLAICGFPEPRVDHARRAVEFALDAVGILHVLSSSREMDLEMLAVVTTGSVVAGVVGHTRPTLEVLGQPASEARGYLAQLPNQSGVVVSPAVNDLVEGDVSIRPLELEDGTAAYLVERKSEA